MPSTKATSFIAELADLMDKYDVHFVIDDTECDTFPPRVYIIQNDWEPIDVPYDWHDGAIRPNAIRKLKVTT